MQAPTMATGGGGSNMVRGLSGTRTECFSMRETGSVASHMGKARFIISGELSNSRESSTRGGPRDLANIGPTLSIFNDFFFNE